MARHRKAQGVTRPVSTKDQPIALSDPIPAVCTIEDVCRLLRISKSQFFNLRRQGVFPIEEIEPPMDRKPRFSGEAVRRYLTGETAPRRRRSA